MPSPPNLPNLGIPRIKNIKISLPHYDRLKEVTFDTAKVLTWDTNADLRDLPVQANLIVLKTGVCFKLDMKRGVLIAYPIKWEYVNQPNGASYFRLEFTNPTDNQVGVTKTKKTYNQIDRQEPSSTDIYGDKLSYLPTDIKDFDVVFFEYAILHYLASIYKEANMENRGLLIERGLLQLESHDRVKYQTLIAKPDLVTKRVEVLNLSATSNLVAVPQAPAIELGVAGSSVAYSIGTPCPPDWIPLFSIRKAEFETLIGREFIGDIVQLTLTNQQVATGLKDVLERNWKPNNWEIKI